MEAFVGVFGSARALWLGIVLLAGALVLPGRVSADAGSIAAPSPGTAAPAAGGTISAGVSKTHDWYCGVGWQSNQFPLCTTTLTATCTGVYSTKVIKGKEYGICHEKS